MPSNPNSRRTDRVRYSGINGHRVWVGLIFTQISRRPASGGGHCLLR
jgi:hypothetical protein